MDGARFDCLTRTLSSRRTALGGVLGGSLAVLLGVVEPDEAGAHNYLARCRQIKSLPRRRACLRRARAHNRSHRPPPCIPQASAVTCAGRCGTWRNNCNQAVPCYLCPPTWSCLAHGSCGKTCTAAGPPCPPGCGCSYPNTEGGEFCIGSLSACPTQTCSSTADCLPGYQCQPCSEGGAITYCFPLCTA